MFSHRTVKLSLILFLLPSHVVAFTSRVLYSNNARNSNEPHANPLHLSNQYDVEEVSETRAESALNPKEQHDDDEKDILRFGGTVTFTSKLLPFLEEKSITDFFADKEHQKILLSGVNEKNSCGVQELALEDVNDALVYRWKKQSILMGAVEPHEEEKDNIVSVKPPGIKIAGLNIVPTSTIGTKYIPSTGNYDLPEFQAVLIDDVPMAEGKRPLVWLFNKIVYGGNPAEDDIITQFTSSTDRNESGLLRVWVEPEGQNFQIKASSTLWLEFQFPSFLLKFFPMRKEKGEKICSDAIVKTLEKNLIPAIENFCSSYTEWKID